VESPTKECTVAAESIVHMSGVERAEPLHGIRQPPLRTVPELVEMVVHQAVRVCPNAESIEHIAETLTELDSITFGEEHGGMIDPTIHHVVPSAFDVDTERSGHAPDHDEGVLHRGSDP
jgi:hypothetical protein